MKSKAKRLQELLNNYAGNEKETIDKVIALFMECVPKERNGKHKNHGNYPFTASRK